MIKFDLHMHSTFSDGSLTPKELVNLVKKENLDYFALTDHDSTAGIEDATYYANKLGIKCIPGIELSTEHNGESIHILGFFKDENYKNPKLIKILDDLKENRVNRAKKIIENLDNFFNIKLDFNKLLKNSKEIITRPHIAKEIIALGYPYDFNEIFDKFIGFESKAYVPLTRISTKEGIKILKDFGALVFLAHPVLLKKSKVEDLLIYDFDGIEALYSQNNNEDTNKFINLAKEKKLYITCGSDYHGIENDKRHGTIGCVDCTKVLNYPELISWIEEYK